MNADQTQTLTSIRILLADDHTIMRQGLSLLLQRQAGLTVIAEATNGHEAVELFRKYRPDILLTDIEMPLMDGITALAAIRSEYPDARGILLTMHARDGLRAEGRAARHAPGCDPGCRHRSALGCAGDRREAGGADGRRRADPTRARGAAAVGQGQEQPGDRRGAEDE